MVIALMTPDLVAKISTKSTFVLDDPIVIKAINCSAVGSSWRTNTNYGRVIVWGSHCGDRSGEGKFAYGFPELSFCLPDSDSSGSGIGISHDDVDVFVVFGVYGALEPGKSFVQGEVGVDQWDRAEVNLPDAYHCT
jgi:hypothetical protein